MLRIKKYNRKKSSGLNYLSTTFYNPQKTDQEFLKKISKKYTCNKIIKDHSFYNIIKEEYLNIYLICLKNLFVLHLTKDLLDEFEFLYNKSDYLFKVMYFHDKYQVYCISKTLNSFQQSTLYNNECCTKNTLLYYIYGNNVIVNTKFNSIYYPPCFVKNIGNGIQQDELANQVSLTMKLIENMKHLPVHYFN